MYCNVTALKVKKLDSGNFNLIITGTKDKKDDLIILADEIDIIRKQIKGERPYTLVWLSDVCYHYKFTSYGLIVYGVLGTQFQHEYTFNSENFLYAIDCLDYPTYHTYEYIKDNVFEFKADILALSWYTAKEPVIINIAQEVKESIKKVMLRKDDNSKELKSWLSYVSRRSHEYTTPVSMNIMFDCFQDKNTSDTPSYYWYISRSTDNTRLYNGGIIFHRDYKEGEYLNTGHYQLHT